MCSPNMFILFVLPLHLTSKYDETDMKQPPLLNVFQSDTQVTVVNGNAMCNFCLSLRRTASRCARRGSNLSHLSHFTGGQVALGGQVIG